MKLFTALADPTRLQIYELITQDEKSVQEIVAHFSFKMPTISQHLRLLREAGLVLVRKQGQKRIYRVDETGLLELEIWLQKQRTQMNKHLDALERHLGTK